MFLLTSQSCLSTPHRLFYAWVYRVQACWPVVTVLVFLVGFWCACLCSHHSSVWLLFWWWQEAVGRRKRGTKRQHIHRLWHSCAVCIWDTACTDRRIGQGKGQASPRNTRESWEDVLLMNLAHCVQPATPCLSLTENHEGHCSGRSCFGKLGVYCNIHQCTGVSGPSVLRWVEDPAPWGRWECQFSPSYWSSNGQRHWRVTVGAV